MSALIRVEEGEITVLAARLESAVAQIRDLLADLDGRVAILRREWTGAAQQAYADAQAEWGAEIDRMVRVLTDAITALAGAELRYDRAEDANTVRWAL
ncbi:hypothetical protein GCM10022198_15860 [Klugiella xanthotipulae]|uniref:ESAT-6-like protein n=1 Tax=Klugiella xanthotipulae TaxID=244735 RepID=A0A543HH23_9MICO|nr:WXG100 family type VII secretion target [Klugiella xanthotipulae]TQM57623.1 WXG100 family type VII secretion target [Klugiella xanthotipulae]